MRALPPAPLPLFRLVRESAITSTPRESQHYGEHLRREEKPPVFGRLSWACWPHQPPARKVKPPARFDERPHPASLAPRFFRAPPRNDARADEQKPDEEAYGSGRTGKEPRSPYPSGLLVVNALCRQDICQSRLGQRLIIHDQHAHGFMHLLYRRVASELWTQAVPFCIRAQFRLVSDQPLQRTSVYRQAGD